MEYSIRLATAAELPHILEIYAYARKFMAENGNPHQWGATHPAAQTLEEENLVFTNRVQDLVMRAVQEVNADKKYKLIINANSLMDADTTLNITAAVLAKANELYAQEKDEVKAE